ncbi:Sodium/hydrogen exchanger 4 [Bienertia sinuspersici]
MVIDLWENGVANVMTSNMGESGHAQVVPIVVFVAVLCLSLVIGHLFEENRWLNESITAILIVLNQDDTPLLYSLVFGEGVVNDATSVVLFNAVQKLDVKKHIFATMSFVAEIFIFLYVGTDVFDMEKWKMTKLGFGKLVGIYATVIFLILVARAAFVFPLSALSNRMNREREISGRRASITYKQQFTYSGVTIDTVNATMVTTTVIVVLFTTMSKTPKDELTLPMLSMDESTATNLSRAKDSLTMLMERPIHTIHSYWRKFDDAYMRPLFGGPIDSQRH